MSTGSHVALVPLSVPDALLVIKVYLLISELNEFDSENYFDFQKVWLAGTWQMWGRLPGKLLSQGHVLISSVPEGLGLYFRKVSGPWTVVQGIDCALHLTGEVNFTKKKKKSNRSFKACYWISLRSKTGSATIAFTMKMYLSFCGRISRCPCLPGWLESWGDKGQGQIMHIPKAVD